MPGYNLARNIAENKMPTEIETSEVPGFECGHVNRRNKYVQSLLVREETEMEHSVGTKMTPKRMNMKSRDRRHH